VTQDAGGGGTARLFVACDLPGEVLDTLSAWQQTAFAGREGLRLSGPLHLTLAFLGEVDMGRVVEIEESLSGIAWSPVRVGVRGVRFLPETGASRVVALELSDPSGGLVALQSEVAAGLARTGLYDPPARPWLPHVTVARFRRRGHPFSLQNVNIQGFGVVRMVLYSSLLERAGAVHTPVAVFPAS